MPRKHEKMHKKRPIKMQLNPIFAKNYFLNFPTRTTILTLHYFYPKNTLKKGLPRMHLSPNFQKFFQPGPRIVARRRRRSAKQVFAGYAPEKSPAHIPIGKPGFWRIHVKFGTDTRWCRRSTPTDPHLAENLFENPHLFTAADLFTLLLYFLPIAATVVGSKIWTFNAYWKDLKKI